MKGEFSYRSREEQNVRGETVLARLWIQQDFADGLRLAAAIERRENQRNNETRFMQQASFRKGLFDARVRFEQRHIEGAQRLSLRLRPLLGISDTFGPDRRWEAHASVELQWTLQKPDRLAQGGVTAYRTDIGLTYRLRDNLNLGVSYLRQRNFRPQGEDQILHIPVATLNLTL